MRNAQNAEVVTGLSPYECYMGRRMTATLRGEWDVLCVSCTYTTSCLRPSGHVGGASSALKLGVSSTSLGGTSRNSADTGQAQRGEESQQGRGVVGGSDGGG